jgi:hypothetical protein
MARAADASTRPPTATGHPEARSGDRLPPSADPGTADPTASEPSTEPEPRPPEPAEPEAPTDRDRRDVRLLLAALALPLLVAAVTLVAVVGNAYHPAADYALTEMQVRDVGRHPVLVGLYSRDTWNHPGPALFYLLAPVYRALGGMSVGIHVGALLINGAAVLGMALIARRRGGMPLMLLTVLGSGLLMRTLGAEFVGDPWNCFVTVLPYGLMIFLTWSMACGDLWALPVGAGVATYLAQTHIGFVPLALPLLVVGAGALAYAAWRPGEVAVERRGLLRAGLVTVAVLGVMWLPPLVDVLVNAPSNLREAGSWFRHGSEQSKSAGAGWRVVTGQFGGLPEWLVSKRTAEVGGESPFIKTAPLPWLLLPVAAGGVYLWRAKGAGRRLVAVVGVTLLLSMAAVARTIGAAFDYRLRWTWVPAMIAAVMAAWAGWRWLVGRRPGAARWLTGAAVAGIVAVTAVNTVTAATQGTPYEADSDVVAALVPDVREAVDDELAASGGKGQVMVGDLFANGSWYARSVVLELERAGYDARSPAVYQDLFGEHRTVDGAGDVRLFVAVDLGIQAFEQQPNLRKVAEWVGITDERRESGEGRIEDFQFRALAGEVTPRQYQYGSSLIDLWLHQGTDATAYAVAVFVEESD